MQSNFRSSIFDLRLSGGMLAVLLFMFAPAALATDPIYVNSSAKDYTVAYPPLNPPPQIDAAAFDNENVYSVDYNTYVNNQVEFCEPWWNTKFFTNNGTMTVNAPFPTNGIIFINSLATGVGFEFDTQAGNSTSASNVMADTFYNPGSIRCDSYEDGNNFFDLIGLSGFIQGSIGEFMVSATNIINPGEVVVSPNGLMQFTGTNLDLSHATLTMEGGGANIVGSPQGFFGLNTNFWDPSALLTPTTAQSAYILGYNGYLTLFDSTPYFNIASPDPSNNIIRAVFIEDSSGSNVNYNVYFDSAGIAGAGNVTIEWIGSSVDAASGNTINNYLYLNDNYDLGASTNVALANGYPDNFAFTESSTPLPLGTAATAGFDDIFPVGTVTNYYAFADAQLISSTVATNASGQNPSGALTNLPGRITINAGRELDLTRAGITGPNYLSIQSPNQFDGSAGARIVSPYSDINIGVTNGFLTVSNLMEPVIRNWSGSVQAWTTRFFSLVPTTNTTVVTDTNDVTTTNTITFTVTNDFRVLIVGSQLQPTTLAYVQDLLLHGTNSLVLSDKFNILRKLSIDSQNLTLETNQLGNGATSPDGELNILSPIAWANAAPNIVNLTNNGAIRIESGTQAQFGADTTTYITNIIPAVLQAQATGTLSELSGTNVAANSKVTIGTNTYTFVKTIPPKNQTPNQIKIAPTFDGTMSNLMAAIMYYTGENTAGTDSFSTNTVVNRQVRVYPDLLSNHSFVVSANQSGSSENSIETTTTSTNLIWSDVTLSGGVDGVLASTNVVAIAPHHYETFINHSLVSDSGAEIWADNFLNDGIFSNGVGSFVLHSSTAVLPGGLVAADGDVALTADTLTISNLALHAGRSLTLTATSSLTDGGSIGNDWLIGDAVGFNGLSLPIKPATGDLLGTTITNIARSNVVNTVVWAGEDRGVSTAGFVNNEAIGHLILDAMPNTSNPGQDGMFKFNGVGADNAIYVDDLEFQGALVNGINNSFDFSHWLSINTNITIYFAQAEVGGVSIAAKLEQASEEGYNGGRLRWVPQYTGQFSSEQIVYPNGVTNTVNAALASSQIDSDGDGIPNYRDSTPFFTAGEMNLHTGTITNVPPLSVPVIWNSIPWSTNYLYYSTNMTGPFDHLVTPPFVSQPNGSWPITNVFNDPITGQTRYYNVIMVPNSTLFYGQ